MMARAEEEEEEEESLSLKVLTEFAPLLVFSHSSRNRMGACFAILTSSIAETVIQRAAGTLQEVERTLLLRCGINRRIRVLISEVQRGF